MLSTSKCSQRSTGTALFRLPLTPLQTFAPCELHTWAICGSIKEQLGRRNRAMSLFLVGLLRSYRLSAESLFLALSCSSKEQQRNNNKQVRSGQKQPEADKTARNPETATSPRNTLEPSETVWSSKQAADKKTTPETTTNHKSPLLRDQGRLHQLLPMIKQARQRFRKKSCGCPKIEGC